MSKAKRKKAVLLAVPAAAAAAAAAPQNLSRSGRCSGRASLKPSKDVAQSLQCWLLHVRCWPMQRLHCDCVVSLGLARAAQSFCARRQCLTLYLWCCREVLRVAPPSASVFRKATVAMEVGGWGTVDPLTRTCQGGPAAYYWGGVVSYK